MQQHHNATTVEELVDGFLFSLEADGKTTGTRKYYEKPLRRFLAYGTECGWADNVAAITTADLRAFLSHAASATYAYTAGNGIHLVRQGRQGGAFQYFRALRRLFNWAVDEGLLADSAMRRIHHRSPRFPRVGSYSSDALVKLLAVCDMDIRTGARFIGLRNRAMLLLFLDGALRRGGMAGLEVPDVELHSKRITFIGKGNKPGTVPFCAKTAKAIWLYLTERAKRARCDTLRITEEGTAFSVDGMDSWFNRLKLRAGVTEPGCLHKLRHTAALQYLRGAKDSFLLQLYLRHESLEMSRRYTQGLKAEEAIEAHRNGASPVEGLGLG